MKKRSVRISILIILILIFSVINYRQQSNYVGRVFNYIYINGVWGYDSIGRGCSGPGSLPDATREYIKYLENFILENKVESVVDAGCGDWMFSKNINWHGAKYLGIDISSIVIDHVKQYESDTVKFRLGDVTDDLPPADLLLCKDVLQHLPNKLINKFIDKNMQSKKYKWAIITNDLLKSGENIDIKVGQYRSINLEKPPFNFRGLVDLPINFGNDINNKYKTSQLIQF